MSDESVTENDSLLMSEYKGENCEEIISFNETCKSNPISIQNHLDSETCVKIPLECTPDSQEEIDVFPSVSSEIQNTFRGLPPGKKYHIFTSCSSEDIEEVNKICEDLEKRFFLRCMQFERDFVAGKRLDDNIHTEMTKSIRVLIALSPAYIKSHWCMTEAYEAVQLAYSSGEKLKIIPVLLRPIDGMKDTPSLKFLKRYRYIDAQKEEDVPAKIMDAYYHSEAVDGILIQGEQELTAEEIQNQNGAYIEKGYVFETESFTYNEREYLKNIHEKCEEQFEAAVSLVSGHQLLKFYKIFVLTKFTHAAAVLLAAIVVSSTLMVQNMAVLVSRDIRIMSNSVSALAVFLGFVLYIIFVLGIFILRKKIKNIIRKKLWQLVNKKYFRETKCLIVYDDSIVLQPCLMLIRYNTASCQEYVTILLDKKHFHLQLDEEEIQIMAAEKIDEKLKQLQCLGLLAEWFQLSVYNYNRHNTWLKKQCLCQLLEGNLIQRKVITV
ncbi:uncharacterized protein LOC133201595 [Saccostrea echinata]|uniref:uncharacterized protein LOC133201595 n=1 Tax=Saccostrea echinata TaxID=191078 RepID=UPI002A81D4B8|nr:uncharacterized protein LOC133201595 [Saccostrea echinata]